MFFIVPYAKTLLIYILAAILPAAFLLWYIYRHDHIEKEPSKLLWSLLLRGVFAALASIVLELIGERILNRHVSQSDPNYIIFLAFLVVAAVEEGTKYFFLYKRTWREPNFNYKFDAVVYAVFVSLGFAAFENVKYVFNYGLSTAFLRAVLAVPGHMGFSVFMGVYYGRARLFAHRGENSTALINGTFAYLAAVFLHGFYDACAMTGTALATILFILFVIVMYIVVIRLIRRESNADHRI